MSKYSESVLAKIETNAVLCLDEDVLLKPDEIKFALENFQEFPEKIVGFPSRLHFKLSGDNPNEKNQHFSRWAYTTKLHNGYSMVLNSAAFVHKYYLFKMSKLSSSKPKSVETVKNLSNCDDILLNFLVSDITGQPPLKILQKTDFRLTTENSHDPEKEPIGNRYNTREYFQERQICLNKFTEDYHYMPLKTSQVRSDPSLYKDDVAAWRKEYKQLEM